ncbi:MAG TPA: hypothetical protein VNG13_00305 [Mycobacteriales bacterium]|nr:hypothetical protein [Mycobacteriales bacterium]
MLSGNVADHRPDAFRVVVEGLGLEIDVAGRTALAEGGQEHAALQDQVFGEARPGQASEEGLQDVELQQLVDWAAIASDLGP